MAGISSLGIGSGLDLSGLVENILSAERIPVENTINRQQNKLTTELSGVGIFRGAVSSFRSSLAGLESASSYSTTNFSNPKSSAMSVSITNDAAVGSYDIDITNLAETHSLASGTFTSLDEVVGTGTLQIKFGTITGPGFTSFAADANSTVQSITLDSNNNTLTGLKDYINEGDFGVKASIINDGSGYRLTMQSNTSGTNGAMEITVTDTGDGNNTDALGLSRLAFNASATQMTQTKVAQDASLTVNGISVTSSSNTLSDMIEGTTLTLIEETAGTPFTLTITNDTSSATDAIETVVDGFNTMINSLNDLSRSDSEGAGILAGDSVLRNFTTQIRSLLTGNVTGLSGSITALSTIGISTQADGTLSIDNSKFSSAVSANPTDALALFAQLGKTTDSNINFDTFSEDSVAGTYDINITQMATQSVMTGTTGLSLPITIDNNNDNISFYIDGISTGSLSLTQGSYTTGTDLATELQLQINSASAIKDDDLTVTVTYDTTNNGFVITSNQYGSDSQIEVTNVDTNTTADLGFSISTSVAGLDVAGTIGGNAAIGTGQNLVGTAGGSNGLSIDIIGGTTGSRGSLQFTRGLISSLNTFLGSYIDGLGILSSKEDGLNTSLESLQDDRDNLERRLSATETRLINQFSALDGLLARFQKTGDFLSQQISSLPGFTFNNSN